MKSLLRRRGLLPRSVAISALVALLGLLAMACGSSRLELEDVAIRPRDVPAEWTLVTLDETELRSLWDVLPELLTSNSNARLLVRALEGEAGLHGAATILIQAEEPSAISKSVDSDHALRPLARLLDQQDALLIPAVQAGDPNAYFAASDLPRPGSVRSRLVRLVDDGYLFSDSEIFTVGPVLAVVTVWYPEDDGPFREIDELASDVERRLRSYLGES